MNTDVELREVVEGLRELVDTPVLDRSRIETLLNEALRVTIGEPRFAFKVAGTPAGQGSISYNSQGRGYHKNGDALKDWRAAVQQAAILASGQHPYAKYPGRKNCVSCGTPRKEHGVLNGRVRVEAVVTLQLPFNRDPDAFLISQDSGDDDHQARSIGDALTGVIYADDAQITDFRIIKTLPGGHPDALPHPGAVIRAWELT
jgi:hypothetical protein